MKRNYLLASAFVALSVISAGCQPKTPAEKAQDKVEDAAHDAGQNIERAGEKVKDSVN